MTVLTATGPERAAGKFIASFPLSHGHAAVYARAADIDPALWDLGFADSHKDFEYYQLLEETMKEGFDYRYLVLSDALDNTLALQPLILVDQDLTASAKSFFTRAVIFLRRFWPRFFRQKMLMAGCLVGDGRLGVIDPANLPTATALLAEALVVYAQSENISLLAVKDFPASQREQLSPLRAAKYTRLPGFPALVLDLNFGSFEEYTQKRLSRAMRKSLRRKLRKSRDLSPPITMEALHDCSTVIDEIYPLYLRVAERSPVQFEIFTREYFLEAGRRMPQRHRYFIWRQAGKVIAFSFCTIWNDSIYDNDIGLDYDVAYNLSLYYLTFRDLIAWALRQGLKFYHSAPFNYDPKLHLRLKPVDVDLYVRHTSPVLNWILKNVAPRFAPANSDPALLPYRAAGARPLWKRALRLFGNPWLQIAMNAVIVTASELFLKVGARHTAHLTEGWNWTGVSGLASIWTWFGIVFVVLSLVSWLYVLRHVPLSIAFPLSNVVHVLVPLSCWIFLGELISTTRWWGIGFVLLGLLIVARPFARIEEKL